MSCQPFRRPFVSGTDPLTGGEHGIESLRRLLLDCLAKVGVGVGGQADLAVHDCLNDDPQITPLAWPGGRCIRSAIGATTPDRWACTLSATWWDVSTAARVPRRGHTTQAAVVRVRG